MMGIAVYLVTRRLTRPLTALAAASGNIARGQLDTALPASAATTKLPGWYIPSPP